MKNNERKNTKEGGKNEKIKIKVEAEVEKTTKTKKVAIVRIVKPESIKQEKGYAEGGVIFEVTENGAYTFEAETNMGKTKRKTIEINISKPESDIEITSEPTTPRNTESTGTQNGIAKGQINVEIKYGDSSFEKQYKKETDENWTTVTGTAVNLTASNLSSYTVYTYYVTVSDGKATTTGKTVTTGTACDYTVAVSHSASYCTDGYVEVTYHTCNGTGCSCGCTAPAGQTHQHGTGNPHYCKHGIPDKHYYCDTHNITNLGSNSTCPGYITCTNSSCSGKKTLTCTNTTKVEKSCGGTLSVTGSSSDQGQTVNFTWKCSVCGTIPSLGTPNATYHDGVAHNKIITAYTCSTHNYSGSSSSHTYTTGCDHGYTSSHYYCDKHGYVGTEKTHKACGHGYIKMHYPN